MPTPVDALNTATIQLLPKLEDTFFDNHILLKRMIDAGLDRRRSGGEYAAFVVTIDGPGNFAKLLTGAEAYSYGRRNITRQARVYIPTHIYAYAVEGEALRHAHGETGIANLLELYPEKALLDARQRSVAQILTGNGAAANIDGLVTMNGDTTYNPDGTALAGVLDFAATTAQTDTVFNLAKSGAAGGVTGWHNQYAAVTSFATNGKRQMRAVYNACRIRSGDYGPPDLGITDATSFNNYYESLDDQVRYAAAKPKTKGEEGVDAGDLGEGLMFHQLELFEDPSMDDNTAQFGHTTDGTLYMLNTKTWGILTLGGDQEHETKGFFEPRGPFKLEGRDAWGFELVCAWQIFCRQLKANGALEGTAIA
jgi:hypothetical protein